MTVSLIGCSKPIVKDGDAPAGPATAIQSPRMISKVSRACTCTKAGVWAVHLQLKHSTAVAEDEPLALRATQARSQ